MPLTLERSNTPWLEKKHPSDFELGSVYVGQGGDGNALTVITATWKGSGDPADTALKSLHKLYVGDRATPVVLVVEVDGRRQQVVGHAAEWAPTPKVEYSTIARVLQAALDDPSPIAARERIRTLRESLESTALPGIKNSGLFALHELTVGVPSRTDYSASCAKSVPLLGLTGAELVRGLGFRATPVGNNAEVLRGAGSKDLAVAIVLQDKEVFDQPSDRLGGMPIAKGIEIAEKNNVSWVILMRRNKIRLYPARNDLGVGRKGVTQTFLELDLPQLTDANAGYLSLIFSAEALAEGGTAYQILESSRQYAVGLGERLRDKVYEEIIPALSLAVAKSVRGAKRTYTPEMLVKAYDLTLRVFFRILFQVYAEDRKLLPLGENPAYDKKALKTLAREMAKDPYATFDSGSTTLWDRLADVWKAIDDGSKPLGIPAYNGGLFSSDAELHPESAAIGDISVSDEVMGPVLRALLLDIGEAGDPVPVDFRSLGVREFGTIYEGLLESSLGVAETDLTLDKDKNWVPVKKKSDEVIAPEGSVYFHNTSGQRKGTGSYFTPSFVVEHLLERSLDPALDAHLASIAELVANGDEATATEKFFDFRVADIAMGSGHFLTAAIDHIEKKMAVFLAAGEHPMPGVQKEILELEAAAKEAVGPDGPEIDRASLLRRQIARRCIYGLDLNPIAVELARVSIWIHTFVRGLPMSSLDHNLVCGNSLTGIGTIDEALDVLNPSRVGKGKGARRDKHIVSAEEYLIAEVLSEARETLLQASQSLELNKAESRSAARAAKKARAQAMKAVRLFDAAVLRRIGRGGLVAAEEFDIEGLIALAGSDEAQKALKPLSPAHMPALFPEVFSREHAGFDVLVGNPPWDKVEHDRQIFLARHLPGFKGVKDQAERDRRARRFFSDNPLRLEEFERESLARAELRQALVAGPYPGMGVDHPDLAKAFAWRNRQLLSLSGAFALVLPRMVLSGRALWDWRRTFPSEFSRTEMVLLANSSNWVFPNVHAQKEFVLVIASRKSVERGQFLGGPHRSIEIWGTSRHVLKHLDTKTLGELGEIPKIPTAAAADVLSKLFEAPRFSQSDFFMQSVYETDATKDKPKFKLKQTPAAGEIPVYKGESIDLWNSDTSKYYAVVEGGFISGILLERTRGLSRKKNSAFFGFDGGLRDLPMARARVAYRWSTNSTNRRTLIVALIPPNRVLTNGIPYLYMPSADLRKEAIVLGVFSSLVFDWLVRRYVEGTMRQGLLNALPFPEIDLKSKLSDRIVDVVTSLLSEDRRFDGWIAKLKGAKLDHLGVSSRASLLSRLDALVAISYGLKRDELIEILDTFHNGDGEHRERRTEILVQFDSETSK